MNTIIDAFDCQFLKIHERSVGFIQTVSQDILYREAVQHGDLSSRLTIGDNLLRSGAAVEVAFGGITTRLWDDPFEWTLPEALSTPELITGYLTEVEATRLHGFTFFTDDGDLARSIPAPRVIRSIAAILIEAAARAEHYQGRAIALFQNLTGEKQPRR